MESVDETGLKILEKDKSSVESEDAVNILVVVGDGLTIFVSEGDVPGVIPLLWIIALIKIVLLLTLVVDNITVLPLALGLLDECNVDIVATFVGVNISRDTFIVVVVEIASFIVRLDSYEAKTAVV